MVLEGDSMIIRLLGLTALFFLSLFLISGCGPKIIPVAMSGAVIDEKRGSISLEKDGITVTARASMLYRTPYDLESYFTPFHVTVRNETGREIRIGYGDFLLLDEKGGQHRAYAPEKMAEIIKSDPEYVVHPYTVTVQLPYLKRYTDPNLPPPYPSGYNYYPNGQLYFDDYYGHWMSPALSRRDKRDVSGETLMQDIYLSALSVGAIVNGAQVTGNIYFKADFREIKSAKVRLVVEGVKFELPFDVK